MNSKKPARAVLIGTLIAGVASQAALASASTHCRTFWPETIEECSGPFERVNASGLNVTSGANNRRVIVDWIKGDFQGQAAPLNSQGQAITACLAQDTGENNGPVTKNCFTANPPAFLFTTSD